MKCLLKAGADPNVPDEVWFSTVYIIHPFPLFSSAPCFYLNYLNKSLFKKKTRPGGGKTAPVALQLRRGQDDPGQETPRTPTLELGTGATFLGPLPNGPGPSWQHSPLGLVPRSWGRYLPGRTQADNTAQVIKSTARGVFSQAGKSAPVGVRTPHLRVPLAAPRPTELTTFGSFQ